jgi:hypothetical protein
MASEQTYQKYRRLARYPLFLAGLLFLIGLALVLDPNIATAQQHHITGRALTLIAWGGVPRRLRDLADPRP